MCDATEIESKMGDENVDLEDGEASDDRFFFGTAKCLLWYRGLCTSTCVRNHKFLIFQHTFKDFLNIFRPLLASIQPNTAKFVAFSPLWGANAACTVVNLFYRNCLQDFWINDKIGITKNLWYSFGYWNVKIGKFNQW